MAVPWVQVPLQPTSSISSSPVFGVVHEEKLLAPAVRASRAAEMVMSPYEATLWNALASTASGSARVGPSIIFAWTAVEKPLRVRLPYEVAPVTSYTMV